MDGNQSSARRKQVTVTAGERGEGGKRWRRQGGLCGEGDHGVAAQLNTQHQSPTGRTLELVTGGNGAALVTPHGSAKVL